MSYVTFRSSLFYTLLLFAMPISFSFGRKNVRFTVTVHGIIFTTKAR
jgi:hypothetical protein